MFDALVLSLPTRNSTMRMRAWRALKESGCAVLRDGLYLLPSGVDKGGMLKQLETEIRESGGFAMGVELKAPAAKREGGLRGLFYRSAEYGELVREAASAKTGSALSRLQRA